MAALHLDYSTAIRADIGKQDFSVCPRHWYIDATCSCARCGSRFVFTAEEQRFWFEELQFWVDSQAKHCPPCRGELRHLKALQQEYDRRIEQSMARDADLDEKRRMLAIIDELADGGMHVPDRMHERREVLARQVERDGT